MTARHLIRTLSVSVLACTAGLMPLNPAKGGSDNPVLTACIEAPDELQKIEICTKALEQDDLNDQERGRAAFHLALAVTPDDTKRAIDLYTQAIALFPRNLSAYHNRGALYQDAKEYDLAAADLTIVIDRMKPKNFDELYGAYWLRASVFAKQEKFSEAMADVDQALTYDPNDIDALEIKAEILSAQEKYDEAVLFLDDAIARHPRPDDITQLWLERAYANGKLGRIGEALEDIDTALELGDNSAWAWYWRGQMHWEVNDRKSTYADIQKSLAIDPHFCRSIWAVNGWSNTVLEMVESTPLEARDFVDDILAEHPEDFRLLGLRFLANLEAEELEAALHDINRMIDVADYPDISLFARARLYKILGQYDLALADLILLIEKDDTRSDVIRQTHQEMQELLDAGKDCVADALSWTNMDLMVLYRFALKQKMIIHAEVFDWESVVTSLDKMIEDDPDDVDNLRKRGITLEELGRPDEALESYDQAIRLIETGEGDRSSDKHGYANTYDYRASIYQSQHRVEQAQSDFDNALKLGDSEFVEEFQLRMQESGHYKGPINGSYDEATKDAMRGCASDIRCTDS